MVEAGRHSPHPAPIPQLLGTIRDRIPDPFRFGLYLVLASTPLLAISGEVFGVVSLRTVSELFLFPLLGILAALVSCERGSLTSGRCSGTMGYAVDCERGGSAARP